MAASILTYFESFYLLIDHSNYKEKIIAFKLSGCSFCHHSRTPTNIIQIFYNNSLVFKKAPTLPTSRWMGALTEGRGFSGGLHKHEFIQAIICFIGNIRCTKHSAQLSRLTQRLCIIDVDAVTKLFLTTFS